MNLILMFQYLKIFSILQLCRNICDERNVCYNSNGFRLGSYFSDLGSFIRSGMANIPSSSACRIRNSCNGNVHIQWFVNWWVKSLPCNIVNLTNIMAYDHSNINVSIWYYSSLSTRSCISFWNSWSTWKFLCHAKWYRRGAWNQQWRCTNSRT